MLLTDKLENTDHGEFHKNNINHNLNSSGSLRCGREYNVTKNNMDVQ